VLKKGSKTHSLPRQSNLQLHNEVCGWTGWRTHRFARSNIAKLHNRDANLSSPKKARPCPKKARKG